MEISPPPASALVGTKAAPARSASRIGALTAGLATGEEDAFREFHQLYSARLLRYHLVLARGDEESAREALQETYLRVVRHARTFADEPSFWCWLTVLARSAACDGGRSRARYWRLIANYARSLFLPTAAPEPDDADERLHDCLLESLGELDETDRFLVEGKYLRHATVRELGLESGLTTKAVESRLLRARRELRQKALRRLRDEN